MMMTIFGAKPPWVDQALAQQWRPVSSEPPPPPPSRSLTHYVLTHRRHFARVHKCSPWQAGITLPQYGSGSRKRASSDVDLEVSEETSSQFSSEGVRFPVKAFAQMCLTDPSSALRLESHVVETLVLGSCSVVAGAGSSVESRSSSKHGGDDWVALDGVKRNGLDAICEFHGVGGWSSVNRGGRVGSGVGVGVGAATERGAPPWQEVVWDWYDSRF